MRLILGAIALCTSAAFAQEGTAPPQNIIDMEKGMIVNAPIMMLTSDASYDQIVSGFQVMSSLPWQEEKDIAALERAILAHIEMKKDNPGFDPLPSYKLLAMMRPENADYAQKANAGQSVAVESAPGADLEKALAAFKKDPETAGDLFDAVNAATSISGLDETLLAGLEEGLKAAVKPVPSSDLEMNLAGYQALSKIRPASEDYTKKVADYQRKIEMEKENLILHLEKEVDDFNGITFYKHPDTTFLANSINAYIGQNDQMTWIRVVLQYYSEDWLFIRSAKANIDGDIVDLPFNDWKRDNSGGSIWEWSDMNADLVGVDVLRRIAASKKTVIRLDGTTYYDDFEVSKRDKKILKDILAAAEILQAKKD